MTDELAKISQAEQALAIAETPEETLHLEAVGQAVIAWAREEQKFEELIEGWRFYIRAHKKTTGLIEPEIVHGDHGLQDHRVDINVQSVPVISDYGLTHKQWTRRKEILSIPDEEIFGYINNCIEKNMEPTKAGLLRTCTTIIPSSTGDEWYTPKEYIDSVRSIMGEIDLDPASCEQANKVIQAKEYFTEADNGLLQNWNGRIFLNPPYSQNKAFSEKLLEEFDLGNTAQAVLLVGAHAIETQWFKRMWDHVLCFTGHRIKFDTPTGKKIAGNISGSVFVYLGDEQYKFAEEFNQHGFVVRRWP